MIHSISLEVNYKNYNSQHKYSENIRKVIQKSGIKSCRPTKMSKESNCDKTLCNLTIYPDPCDNYPEFVNHRHRECKGQLTSKVVRFKACRTLSRNPNWLRRL